MFSDNYDVLYSESTGKIQFNAGKMMLIDQFLQKWRPFEFRVYADFVLLTELGYQMIYIV